MSSQLQNNLFAYWLDLYETLESNPETGSESGSDDGSNNESGDWSDVDTDSGSDDGSDYEDPDAELYARIIDEWTASTQATNLANMQEELAQNQDIIPIYLPEYSSHR